MIEIFISFDRELFFFINKNLQNGFFDWLMPLWRNKITWIPLYLVLIFLIIRQYRWKGVLIIAMLMITAGIADYTSSSIVKPLVDRVRPCNNPALSGEVRNLINCGVGKSFTSSHATNHFSIAFFLSLVFGKRRGWVWPVSIFWAAMVGLAQVYVGVHYPGDIMGGALLGGIIAAAVFITYMIIAKKNNLQLS